MLHSRFVLRWQVKLYIGLLLLIVIGHFGSGLAHAASSEGGVADAGASQQRPNFLFAIADDWGWPHAGAYGAPVVQTPTFDSIAKRGLLLEHAYVSSPSCTPSRGAILTGQWHWRLAGAANLWSVFPDRFDTYPLMLKEAEYFVGRTGKAWGPGRTETPGRALAGPNFKNFAEFLEQRPADQPFCFWLGSSDPHRPYRRGSGAASGMNVDEVEVFPCFPDVPEIRSDFADYFFEVQRFDRLVGDALELLEERGELKNTVVFMTGDHGMPFPRCKANLYDSGARVPLAIMWPEGLTAKGRVSRDFVSLTDIAPTILELAGVTVPEEMTGRSLVPLIESDRAGQIDSNRSSVLIGKERHVPSQEGDDMGGYPCRAIRTHEYLLILNLRPDRWPAGTPDWQQAAIPGVWLGDCDNGPTKSYLVENRERDTEHQRAYQLAFGRRPRVELYDCQADPGQLINVADKPGYREVRERLLARLRSALNESGDPRFDEANEDEPFDNYEYLGGGPKHPDFRKD